ncbi:CBS domain-containing protein [Pseudogracilibacillus sp. ICA-222130]|uniref:CBS domain-containing protein n=1 Tax=Pseudogracilibacillus sp. ICA-222130 TaxID=3134655 RepID=UPI0030BA5F0E
MQVIVTHMNTDFDALASLYAAKKLYPDATVVLSDKQETKVRQFLNIYRDTLPFTDEKDVNWDNVTDMIIVDVANGRRIGPYMENLDMSKINVVVFDHHPPKNGDIEEADRQIEQVGATVTLLIEKIVEQQIPISSFEATLFGLGIYTDTNAFMNDITSARDFKAASFLMDHGMSLEMVHQFSEHVLLPEQQQILNDLFTKMDVRSMDGLEIVVAASSYDFFQSGLATITSRLLDITNTDAVITVVGMKNHVHIVGRASSDRINLLPLLKKFEGGGHEKAGSAMVKRSTCEEILPKVVEDLDLISKPGITVKDMMVYPVKTLTPDTTIEEAGRKMYRYGHSGYPVVQEGKLIGMVTRRDLDKANHHGLGHAPVKAYMSTNLITVTEEKTLEEIQQLIIERNIGRLPVIRDGKLVGIITRTNIIEKMHEIALMEETGKDQPLKTNLKNELKDQLEKDAFSLLENIRKTAKQVNIDVYLVGGIVRDLFLRVPNDDIDIVVEGSGIEFAKRLTEDHGGEVIIHESFGTATWETVDGFSIDVTTSRLEYYDRPASLPDVESSYLAEDLQRRDFTINAMAVCLTGEKFGDLIDPYNGQQDLRNGNITILHNLSFVEDPTRILRAVRFETRFEFLMDKQTEQLALQSISTMRHLSNQRIVDELIRIFKEDNIARAMMRLYDVDFWKQYNVDIPLSDVIERVKKLRALFDMYEHAEPDWFHYVAIPFFDHTFNEPIKEFALTKKEMKFIRAVEEFFRMDGWRQTERSGDIHAYAKAFEDDVLLFILSVSSIDNEEVILQYIERRKKLEQYITGADLILRGLKPGAHFKELLLQLEIATLNKEITTKEEAFAWMEANIP